MKVFISADIEGITTTTNWNETDSTHPFYPRHAEQMTKEVLAACEGAFAGGATEITVNDAHGSGLNINPTVMPKGVTLRRGWSGHPYSMADGVDGTFDCAMFVGYHSAASRPGNPLSHTSTGRPHSIKVNGRITSEFMLYSWACALEGVPTVMLTGDKMLCEDYADLHENLVTVPVKEGKGSMTIGYSPEETLAAIKEGAKKAVAAAKNAKAPKLADHFAVEVCYKDHHVAERVSYFPGVKKVDSYTVSFETDRFLEVLRTLNWIL